VAEPRLYRPTHFGVFIAQGTCLVAANVLYPPLGDIQRSPKSLSWISGATSRRGKERRKGKKGEKRK